MNYYKRHIGDYAKKAGHLSVLEHGVYTLLLDSYYDREQAPTRAEAIRQARARTPEEIAAVDAVLGDFFNEVEGRFVQARVEEEFVKAEEIAKLNAAKGKLGGRPRKPKGKPAESRRVSEVKPIESPEKPNPLIHQSTNSEKPKQPQAALPEWIDPEAWAGFDAMRRKERHPLTERATTLILKSLGEFRAQGHDPNASLDQSTRNGWRDVFPLKPGESNGRSNGSAPRLSLADQSRAAHERAERHRDPIDVTPH